MQSPLAELLSEPVAAAKKREAITFEKLAGARPLILFGAGGMGRRTLAGLRGIGIEPLLFCDSNAALWGGAVDGLPVVPLEKAAAQYGRTAAFVITIWSGHATERMVDREELLRGAGCQTVLHWGPLYWRYQELFPHYSANAAHLVLAQREAVQACARLWADDSSRSEYLAQIRWRLHFDFDGLGNPVTGPMYFRDEFHRSTEHEVFVDCGAYDGDTVRSFIRHSGGRFKKIYAFEPDPANFQKLRSMPGIVAEQAAVGRSNGFVSFSADGTEASSAGNGKSEVECVALDQYLAGESPTLIKMDIEGFEPEALAGARGIIARDSPMLAICVYHAQDHLWRIPLQIQTYNPCYRFYLRPHLYHVWDLVCYAVPHQHVRPPSTESTAPVI